MALHGVGGERSGKGSRRRTFEIPPLPTQQRFTHDPNTTVYRRRRGLEESNIHHSARHMEGITAVASLVVGIIVKTLSPSAQQV